MAQQIVVVPHDPAWGRAFAAEARVIRAVLGENCLAVYHIGSTAAEGLWAKPILDILPVVRDLEAVNNRRDALTALGYEYLGEFGIPGRRYLRKGGDERTHQVHIFQAEDRRNIVRHLAVREYLRHHPEARAAYGELKRALAARFPDDIEGYCDGKDAFVRDLEARALEACGQGPFSER